MNVAIRGDLEKGILENLVPFMLSARDGPFLTAGDTVDYWPFIARSDRLTTEKTAFFGFRLGFSATLTYKSRAVA